MMRVLVLLLVLVLVLLPLMVVLASRHPKIRGRRMLLASEEPVQAGQPLCPTVPHLWTKQSLEVSWWLRLVKRSKVCFCCTQRLLLLTRQRREGAYEKPI